LYPAAGRMASDGPIEVKVCIIGDTDVGKTSISMRYVHGEFPDNSTPTIGASFLQKKIDLTDTGGCVLSLQMWDTAGQERFRSMAPMYYRGAKAALLVFDCSKEETFHRVVTWQRDLEQHASPNCVLMLCGNKCDKKSGFELGACEEYAESIGASFIKCSALTGENIDDLFNELGQKILQVLRKEGIVSRGAVDKVVLSDGGSSVLSSCC